MARQHWRMGAQEILGSVSKSIFLRRPAPTCLIWLGLTLFAPGRACGQAVSRDGTLVDDFVIDHRPWVTLVRNAPSPAATASLAIAEHIVAMRWPTTMRPSRRLAR